MCGCKQATEGALQYPERSRSVRQLRTGAPVRSGTRGGGGGVTLAKEETPSHYRLLVAMGKTARYTKSYIISTCDGKREHPEDKTGTRARRDGGQGLPVSSSSECNRC